jgi:peptidoglycan hydrolase-like protein with peptidoglycan-binding domain
MEKNIQIQIQEISRLMNYDRSKTLLEQSEFAMDRRYGISKRNARALNMTDAEYEKEINKGSEEMAKLIYEYRHGILDALAIGTFFIPVVGPLISLGIEVGNAALYLGEGDKEMAALTAAFALIPGGEYIRQIPAIKNVSKSTIIKIFQKANKGKALSNADKEILEAIAENSGKISRLSKLGALGKMLSAFGKLSLKQRLIVIYKLIKQFPGMGGKGFGLINQGLIQIGGILYTVPKLFEVFGIDGSEPNGELISQIESAWGNTNDKELNDALEGAFGMLPEDERDSAVAEFFGWVDEAEKTGESNTNKTQTSDKKENTTDSNSIPQDIVDGVMKKGYLIRRGIHNQESKYPGMMKAIEFIQKLVGAKVDGKFGPETEGKVKDYQKSKGLKDDGIVGKNTMSKIIEDIK